jgi:hypothetical protein
MPKRFSLVDCGEQPVVVSGFIEPGTLPEINSVVDKIMNTSNYERVIIGVSYLIYNDIEGTPLEDATVEEVEVLQEKLPEFHDEGVLVFYDGYEIELDGELEEKLVDSSIE